MTDIGRRRGATFAALISLIALASLAAALIGCAVGPEPSWRPTGRKNLDGEPHTVRGPDDQVRSSALDQSESYSVKFDKPGTYKYGCSIHPKMSGTIIVL